MPRFFIDFIRLVNKNWLEHIHPPLNKSTFPNLEHSTNPQDASTWLTYPSSDQKLLRLYKAMDLAG